MGCFSRFGGLGCGRVPTQSDGQSVGRSSVGVVFFLYLFLFAAWEALLRVLKDPQSDIDRPKKEGHPAGDDDFGVTTWIRVVLLKHGRRSKMDGFWCSMC